MKHDIQAALGCLRAQIDGRDTNELDAFVVSGAIEIIEHQLAKIERLTAENARLQRIVQDFDNLIGSSGGVYGLHLNGDPAPWSEIMPGGRFEDWLINYGEPASTHLTEMTTREDRVMRDSLRGSTRVIDDERA